MATVFSEGDLFYNDYKRTAYPADDPHVTGKPDSTLLNRLEAYEMAYFINRYMQGKNWSKISTGQKIEKFLRASKSGSLTHADWIKELNRDFIL